MKNFPNQASSIERIRATLDLIQELNEEGGEPQRDDVLGYLAARRGVYTFRSMAFGTTPTSVLEQRISDEQKKSSSNQGPHTFARDLRKTLRLLGWLDEAAYLTAAGQALLKTRPNSAQEQAILSEGLLNIVVTEKDGSDPHHPMLTLLRLLAYHSTQYRHGLELAFAPRDDSLSEFDRIASFYDLPRDERAAAINTSPSQQDNAVKILPALAVTAGLVVEDEDNYYSLSQDGWQILGSSASPTQVREKIEKRGRKRTVAKLITVATVASRRNSRPPRGLSYAEQIQASARLLERTVDHQALVRRTAQLIGDNRGVLFEDEFSFDLLWLPEDGSQPAILFEMKTVIHARDAYARTRHAVGQLSYYDFFYASPRLEGRDVIRCAVFDNPIPAELGEYLSHEYIAGLVISVDNSTECLNQRGEWVLDLIAP